MDMIKKKEMFGKMWSDCVEIKGAGFDTPADFCKNVSKEEAGRMMAACGCSPKAQEKVNEYFANCGCEEKE